MNLNDNPTDGEIIAACALLQDTHTEALRDLLAEVDGKVADFIAFHVASLAHLAAARGFIDPDYGIAGRELYLKEITPSIEGEDAE